MRGGLTTIFVAILILMLTVTVWASLHQSIWSAGHLFAEPWFVATFVDAYCGFITFFVWVAYKERGIVRRLIWLVAILCFGNIATAIYVLLKLAQLRTGDGIEQLLGRRNVAEAAT